MQTMKSLKKRIEDLKGEVVSEKNRTQHYLNGYNEMKAELKQAKIFIDNINASIEGIKARKKEFRESPDRFRGLLVSWYEWYKQILVDSACDPTHAINSHSRLVQSVLTFRTKSEHWAEVEALMNKE